MTALHSIEAEQSVLGAALYSPPDCGDAFDRLSETVFHDPVNGALWAVIADLTRKGRLADPVTVHAAMGAHPGYAEMGGLTYLGVLVEKAALGALSAHVDFLCDMAARRAIQSLTAHVSAMAGDTSTEDAAAVLNELERGAAEIAREGGQREHWAPVAFVTQQALASARDRKGIPGTPIGLEAVDRITGGLRKGQLTLLAGRPGMGKSTAALAVAKSVAAKGQGVAFFSLEMTETELGLRLACDVAFNPLATQYAGQDNNASYSKAEWGALTPDQWDRLDEARGVMASWPLMFDCRPALTPTQILTTARRIVRNWQKAGITPGCIIVDHLGLIRPDQARGGSKVAEIGDVSGALREMAKQLGVPVVALCQLSRDVEKRDTKDRRPGLSDLRWAGELEQDAHVVMFLYRPEYYLKPPELTGDDNTDFENGAKHGAALERVKNKLVWIVAKNRQGPTAEAELFCRIDCSAIRDIPDQQRMRA